MIDPLQIYRGSPYIINDRIKILQPTLGQIADFGEQRYFNMVHTITAISSDMKYQLSKMGLDYEEVKDFDLFSIMIKQFTPEDTCLLFGDIDFSKLEDYENEQNGLPVLYDPVSELKIDINIYNKIVDYLRQVHMIAKKEEFAANKLTKKILIEESKRKYEESKNKEYESTLVPLISALTNHPGFKYGHGSVWSMPINAFMDAVQRLQVIQNVDNMLRGIYAGTISSKGINQKDLNWLRSMSEK